MNWQAGTMLHPGAQRSEHRIKAPACRETQQAGTVTTSWQSGRQHGARPQHHLGISLRLAPTQHNHCIPLSQNNLKPLSEKRGEDQGVKDDTPFTPALEKVADGWSLALPRCVFPKWRPDGAPSHVTTLLPEHPIARGIPATWDVPHTEMYGGPFHVPKPDAVIFSERWDKGETFDYSGAVWNVGKGKVFYFRPGHETYAVFKEALPLLVIENAVRWLATSSP